jgi:hypothetical protein
MKSPRLSFALTSVLLASVLAAACSDDEPTAAPASDRADASPDAIADAANAADGTADGGATDIVVNDNDASVADAQVAPTGLAPAGIAILSSDRKSTALSLLALDGTTLAMDQCFHSGSQAPQLSAALSGDVVLPSAPQPRNEIALVDRKNGTITWLDPATCAVLRQMNVGPGFASNPYDLVGGLPGGKGYVARYNTDPGNPAIGSDLLIIDTATAAATGRIDLRAFAPAVTPPTSPLLPDPVRFATAKGLVYVLLNNLSADYSAAGDGRLVVIDPTTDAAVGTIDLPGLQNCGALQAVAQPTADALVVGCSGSFSAGPAQIDNAGVAWIDLAQSPPLVTVVKSAPFGRPVSGFDVGVLDPALAFTVVSGEFGKPPTDAVWAFDFQGGAPRRFYESDSSFSLSLTLDRDRRRLFVLDAGASAPRVHIFALPIGGAPTEAATLISNPTAGLPPRVLALY